MTRGPGRAARASSIRSATQLIEREGIVLLFPSDRLSLRTLWEAVTGNPNVRIFHIADSGKRVLTPELRRVWSLKNQLAAERRACVGKHISARIALISPFLVPAFYSLTGRHGELDDFDAAGNLSELEEELARTLLLKGPRTAVELRRQIPGGIDAAPVKRALERLQRSLVVTQAGEAAQAHGWDASIFDLVARRFHDRLRRIPPPLDGQNQIAIALRTSNARLSAAQLAAIIGLPNPPKR